jgi:hypothetical protein
MELGDIPYKSLFMLQDKNPSWRKQPNLPQAMKECLHHWEDNNEVPAGNERCNCCLETTNNRMRAHCMRCRMTVFPMCSKFILGRKIPIRTQNIAPYDSKDSLINELLGYINYLLAENARLKDQILEKELVEDMSRLWTFVHSSMDICPFFYGHLYMSRLWTLVREVDSWKDSNCVAIIFFEVCLF